MSPVNLHKVEEAHLPRAGRGLLVVACCFHANGASSYRDARNIAALTQRVFSETEKKRILILSDAHCADSFFDEVRDFAEARTCRTRDLLLRTLRDEMRAHSPTHDVLFTLSSHGYSRRAAAGDRSETDGRDEYIRLGGDQVLDHELREALYAEMHPAAMSLALVDTCHSGTMLDLPHTTRDGVDFTHTALGAAAEARLPPASYCISACDDAELSGEDVSEVGGWGGRLICQFLDYATEHAPPPFHPADFFRRVRRAFVAAGSQRSHPVFSCTTTTTTTTIRRG